MGGRSHGTGKDPVVTFLKPHLSKKNYISSQPAAAAAHLQAVWMCNLVADGALHQHEVELVLLVIHRVLLAGLSADDAHGRVGQDGLVGGGGRRTQSGRWVRLGPTGPTRDGAAPLKLKVRLSLCRVSVRGAEAPSTRHSRSLCGHFQQMKSIIKKKKINPTKTTSSTFKRLRRVMSDLIDALREIYREGSQAATVSGAPPLPPFPAGP